MNNIKIKDVAIYHPQNVVENDYYIKHFDEKGKDISSFLNAIGRKNRYIINDFVRNFFNNGY